MSPIIAKLEGFLKCNRREIWLFAMSNETHIFYEFIHTFYYPSQIHLAARSHKDHHCTLIFIFILEVYILFKIVMGTSLLPLFSSTQ